MSGLENRLRQIEDKLKMQLEMSKGEPQYLDLLELPQETVVDTFRVLKEATGGYQCLVVREQIATADQEDNDLDELTPEQLYNILKPQQATKGNLLQVGQ